MLKVEELVNLFHIFKVSKQNDQKLLFGKDGTFLPQDNSVSNHRLRNVYRTKVKYFLLTLESTHRQ